ncbi:MAG: Crp/Fnr family transcriptional regulator [Bacteroidetes bacterium]|nr:Crp/Fnr family transcriptional regulator [Bacteroidota bacterium]
MISNSLFTGTLKEEVQSFGQVKTFPAGTRILSEQSYIQVIPIVLKGSLRVVRTEKDGREILLYYIAPGESCIMSFLGGLHHEPSQVMAIAEEEAELLLIPVAKAGEWVKKFPEWTDFIFKLYHKRFEELLSVVNAIAFQKLDDRLLHLLIQKSKLFNSKEIKTTHQQLAQELGTTREVISRIIKQMEHDGLVKLARNKIVLV